MYSSAPFFRTLLIAVIVVVLVSVTVVCQQYSSTSEKTLAPGVWGGERLIVEVAAGGATLEFECAAGEIASAIALDADGRFDVEGTFTSQGPGPTRRESPQGTPVRYRGQVSGDAMTLELVRDGKVIGTYSLTRGSRPMLKKCR